MNLLYSQKKKKVMNLLSFGVRTMNKFSENKTLDFRNHVAY